MTLAAADPQHAARSSDSPLTRPAMKPPQKAFPHPVTSAKRDWSSRKAGTSHVSPVAAECTTAPFSPRRTHTIFAPASARRRHSSAGEPSPTRDTASSSLGEKTSPAEHSVWSVSIETGRVARVNGSTLRRTRVDAFFFFVFFVVSAKNDFFAQSL
jgi:hypothetical protein